MFQVVVYMWKTIRHVQVNIKITHVCKNRYKMWGFLMQKVLTKIHTSVLFKTELYMHLLILH